MSIVQRCCCDDGRNGRTKFGGVRKRYIHSPSNDDDGGSGDTLCFWLNMDTGADVTVYFDEIPMSYSYSYSFDYELTFDPPWHSDMMSEAARLQTGMY